MANEPTMPNVSSPFVPAPGKPGSPSSPPGTKADTKGKAGKPGEEEGEEELFLPTFWQNPMVQNVLPFCTSLALHAGIIILGLVTLKTIETVVAVVREQITIPDSTLVDGSGPPGGIPNPGIGGDPTRAMAQDQDPTVSPDSQGLFDKKGFTNLEAGGGAGDQSGESVIGLGASSAFGRGSGIGSGSGSGKGSGVGDGTGDLAPFGMPGGGGGIGPKGNFFGSGGSAMSVAYVCDASGSMLGQQFDLLKEEIKKSVDKLSPVQGYDVVFFRDEGCHALSDSLKTATLVMANTENKQRTIDFLNSTETRGQTNPLPALKHAIRMKPQLIFLLTDGVFENPEIKTVLEEVRKMNSDKRARINTIAFYRQDVPASERALCDEVLNTIAKENGGDFKVVTTQELMNRRR